MGKLYRCALCHQIIDEYELPIHLLIHLEGKLGHCSLCVKGFEMKEELIKHLLKHVENIIHVVNVSDPDSVSVNRSRVNHETSVHRERHQDQFHRDKDVESPISRSINSASPILSNIVHQDQYHRDNALEASRTAKVQHKCEMCAKVFSQAQSLLNHQQHYHRAQHTCKYCGQTFTSGPLFRSHQHQCYKDKDLEYNVSEETYECSTCKRQFQTEPALQVHMEMHKVHFHCTYCKKDFHNAWEKQEHRNSKCNICGTVFICDSHLTTHTATHAGDAWHKCEVCGKVFAQRQSLLNHQQHYHKVPHICKLCGQTFTSAPILRSHQDQCHRDNDLECSISEETFVCKTCRCQFQTESALQVHMELHKVHFHCKCNYCGTDFHNAWEKHKHRNSKCKICGKSFVCESHLTIHEASHTGEAQHKCKVCSKVFAQRQALVNHQQRYHKGPHICKYCGKTLSNASILRKHQDRYHKDNDLEPTVPKKTYVCNICSRQFKTECALQAHVETTHEVYYHCSYCGTNFNHAWVKRKHRHSECKICGSVFLCTTLLTAHEASHAAKVEHKCGVCAKVFSQAQSLFNHEQNHKLPHICKYCGQTFTSSAILRSHQDQSHREHDPIVPEETYECSTCRCQFQTESALQVHMELHVLPFHCTYCGKDFNNAWEKHEHRNSKCKICGSTFICTSHLTTHTAAHTGEVPHKCEVCRRVFTQSHSLLSHKCSKIGAIFKYDL